MEFVIGGLAAASAGILTNPLEVMKHHMDLDKKSPVNRKYRNFIHAGYVVTRSNGVKSLQKGLSPAMLAHLTSYGMKLGKCQLNKPIFFLNFRYDLIQNNYSLFRFLEERIREFYSFSVGYEWIYIQFLIINDAYSIFFNFDLVKQVAAFFDAFQWELFFRT